MAPPLQFAIIGCGKIAPRHAAEACKHGQLAAVCDVMPEKADALSAAYNSRAYYDLHELLAKEQLDVVAVCTPNGLHAEHSIAALRAGAHVLCEKPLCISSADGRKMSAAAEETGKKLFVVKSTRYNPALAGLKSAIETEKLGRIYSFQLACIWNRPPEYYHRSWKGKQALDGGTLFTQFSHYIDALLWLLGDIDLVHGWRSNRAHEGIIEFEDTGVAAVKMASGILGTLNWSVNSFRKNMEVSLTLVGEKGTIQVGGEYMNKINYQEPEPLLAIAEGGSANDYGFYKGSMSNHDKIYENLVKALRDPSHAFTNAADGLRTVEAIEKIYNSVHFER